jgi:hypothetical protein
MNYAVKLIYPSGSIYEVGRFKEEIFAKFFLDCLAERQLIIEDIP